MLFHVCGLASLPIVSLLAWLAAQRVPSMKASPVGNAALRFLHWMVEYVLRRNRAAQLGHTMIEPTSLLITWIGMIVPTKVAATKSTAAGTHTHKMA